ncbi:hypothetical protein [Halalkalicoccus ordinarius]|uniref:hypothetical protein n=1 Tax=Halalkalicoccus ordinarius TaxID=3116651 RepID=UPI00300ED585
MVTDPDGNRDAITDDDEGCPIKSEAKVPNPWQNVADDGHEDEEDVSRNGKRGEQP